MTRAAFALLAVASTTAAQRPPSLRPDPAKAQAFEKMLATTMANWQKNTGIAITPAAEKRMMRDVLRQRAEVRRWQKLPADTEEELTLNRELLRAYCFDLRDRKRRPSETFVLVQTRPMTLDRPDVERYTVRNLLEALMRLFGPREVGYIEVTSPPPGAEIYFNSNSAPSGTTSRNFVVAAGPHTVRIISSGAQTCAARVDVRPRARSTVTCDKRGSAD